MTDMDLKRLADYFSEGYRSDGQIYGYIDGLNDRRHGEEYLVAKKSSNGWTVYEGGEQVFKYVRGTAV